MRTPALWLLVTVLLGACDAEFQQGDGTDSIPDDTAVVEPPDTATPAPPRVDTVQDTIRVDSTSMRPDSVVRYVVDGEEVPSDLDDPYWLERQDTLSEGNYIVIRDLLPWGEWTEPDTIKGRILPLALAFWEGEQMVGCSGGGCPRYDYPATDQDSVTWERKPVPEPPEVEPFGNLAVETVATDAEAVTYLVSWDGPEGSYRVFGCCRTFEGSWPGSPYVPDTDAESSPVQVRQPRLRDSSQVDVCVVDVPTGEELCETVDVPDLPAPPEPTIDTAPDPVPGAVTVVRTEGGFIAQWTDTVGEESYLIQQRCTRDGLQTWCRVWDDVAGTVEAVIDRQWDGSALESGATYGYRLRACNVHGCGNREFSGGAS